MKKLILFIIIISVLMLSGCGHQSNEKLDIIDDNQDVISKVCVDYNNESEDILENYRWDERYRKGYVEFGEEKVLDICRDENILVEAICDDSGVLNRKEIICDCGCFDGACRKLPLELLDSTDSIIIEKNNETHIATFELTGTIIAKDEPLHIEFIRLFITKTMELNSTEMEKIYEVDIILNPGENYTTEPWQFEYTDGYSPEYPRPKIWMERKVCGVYK